MALTQKDLIVLKAIYFQSIPTRNSISEYAGLSTVVISSILSELEDKDIIRKTGKTKTKGGRPSAIYQITPDMGFFVGISVKTESLMIISMDATARIIKKISRPLTLSSDPLEHINNIKNQIISELDQFLKKSGKKQNLLAIGISVPGMVDTEKGIWLHGLWLTGITGFDFRNILEKKFKVPVFIEDLSRANAWYEKIHFQGNNAENMVALYLGTGVGAGIIINNSLYRGHNGLSGEIGHLIVDKEGPRCSCGNIGCLETKVSVPAIIRTFNERLEEGVISSLQKYCNNGNHTLTLENILSAADNGDRITQSTLFEIGLFLGDACAKTIKFYSPDVLLISGPASILGKYFEDAINIVLSKKVIAEMTHEVKVEFSQYNHDHEAVGTALIAMHSFWQKAEIKHIEKDFTTSS